MCDRFVPRAIRTQTRTEDSNQDAHWRPYRANSQATSALHRSLPRQRLQSNLGRTDVKGDYHFLQTNHFRVTRHSPRVLNSGHPAMPPHGCSMSESAISGKSRAPWAGIASSYGVYRSLCSKSPNLWHFGAQPDRNMSGDSSDVRYGFHPRNDRYSRAAQAPTTSCPA